MAPSGPPPASASAILGGRDVFSFISAKCRGEGDEDLLHCSRNGSLDQLGTELVRFAYDGLSHKGQKSKKGRLSALQRSHLARPRRASCVSGFTTLCYQAWAAAGSTVSAAAALRAGAARLTAALGVALTTGLTADLAAGLTVFFAATFTAALAAAFGTGFLAESFCTLLLSSSMRVIRALTSLADGTPSLFSALATRSSKMLSSLSHWPEALDEMSVAMVDILLVASEIFSSATDCVLRCKLTPSLTRASKALEPSAWALLKAPRPACQICWAESLTDPFRSVSVFFLGVIFFNFLTMKCSR